VNATHALVEAWCPLERAPGAGCVVPSAAGARLLRRAGWRGFQAALAEWAGSQGLAAAALRVVSALPVDPAGDAPAASRLEPQLLGLESAGERALLCRLRIPFELAIFHGHFPTVPIVPGAQLTGWAALLAARHAGWRHGARAAQVLKFRRIVQPGHEPLLALRWDEAATRLEFRYERAGHLHAQGTLLSQGLLPAP
jgi:3-hydroxymyristoyl/3-hydroxydecanoyl-(acyl carrier protein) dehydratase